MSQNSNSPDDASVERIAGIVRETVGADASKKIESVMKNSAALEQITSSLSPDGVAVVNALMQNPEMLKKLLSSPKARAGLKKILGE